MSKFDNKPFNSAHDGRIILMNPNITNDFLHIYYAGITLPTPTFRVHHNTNDHNAYHMYTFEYILSGSGYIEADHKTVRVTKGDLFFLHRDRRQIYYSDPSDPFKKMFVAVCGNLVDQLVAAYQITESVLCTPCDCEHEFYRLFDTLESNRPDIEDIALTIHRMLQRLKPPILQRSCSPEDTPAKKVREYININLQNDLSLSDIAAYFNISPSSVNRIFKQEYGITPIQYLLSQRMKKAAFFLKNTDLKVYEIAEMLGYDSKAFSKQFSHIMGCSPRQYKLQSIQQPPLP